MNAFTSPTGYPFRLIHCVTDENNREGIIFAQQLGKVIKGSQILPQGRCHTLASIHVDATFHLSDCKGPYLCLTSKTGTANLSGYREETLILIFFFHRGYIFIRLRRRRALFVSTCQPSDELSARLRCTLILPTGSSPPNMTLHRIGASKCIIVMLIFVIYCTV